MRQGDNDEFTVYNAVEGCDHGTVLEFT